MRPFIWEGIWSGGFYATTENLKFKTALSYALFFFSFQLETFRKFLKNNTWKKWEEEEGEEEEEEEEGEEEGQRREGGEGGGEGRGGTNEEEEE